MDSSNQTFSWNVIYENENREILLKVSRGAGREEVDTHLAIQIFLINPQEGGRCHNQVNFTSRVGTVRIVITDDGAEGPYKPYRYKLYTSIFQPEKINRRDNTIT